MNERIEENVIREPLHKIPHALTNGRGKVCFCLLSSRIYLQQENKNTAQKTEQDVRSLERFLKTKDEDRKIVFFSAVDFNEYIGQFIISVRTQDGTEYDYGKNCRITALDISDFAKVRVQKGHLFSKAPVQKLLPNTIISLRDKLLVFQTRCGTTQINLGKGAQKVKRTHLVVVCFQLSTIQCTNSSYLK